MQNWEGINSDEVIITGCLTKDRDIECDSSIAVRLIRREAEILNITDLEHP